MSDDVNFVCPNCGNNSFQETGKTTLVYFVQVTNVVDGRPVFGDPYDSRTLDEGFESEGYECCSCLTAVTPAEHDPDAPLPYGHGG